MKKKTFDEEIEKPSQETEPLQSEKTFLDLAETVEKPKRAYKKKKEIVSESHALDLDSLKFIVNLYFDRRGSEPGQEHWKLKNDEQEKLTKALDKVILKYAPGALEKWGDEIALAAVSLAVVLPRYLYDLEVKKREKKEADKKEKTLE